MYAKVKLHFTRVKCYSYALKKLPAELTNGCSEGLADNQSAACRLVERGGTKKTLSSAKLSSAQLSSAWFSGPATQPSFCLLI